MPKWSRQVRVCSGGGGGVEERLGDGYSWRKYGQKDILGSKHPRGYYRCTHRNSKGCLATKQVQRSDENPSIFDITYRGAHTCTEKNEIVQPEDNSKQNLEVDQPNHDLLQQLQQQQDQQLLQSLRAELAVKTEDINSEPHIHGSSSFTFPSTPVSCAPLDTTRLRSILDNSFMANFCPTFVSAPEPNYFSLSQRQMSTYRGEPSLGAQETEHAEATPAAATSMANSPMVDMDFVMRSQGEYGPDFSFDGTNFF